MLGSVLYVANNTFGLHLAVMHIDKKADRCDVVRSYTPLVGLGMWALQFFMLYITSLKQDLEAFAVSCALMGFQEICLNIFVSACKKCLGDNGLKLCTYPIPVGILTL